MRIQSDATITPPKIQKEYEDPWNKLNIDLDAAKSNYLTIKSTLPPGTLFYAVLKSDAYGHNLKEIGRILHEAGCRHFSVESPEEGIQLRNEGISGEILLMNPIPSWMAELSVRHDLSVSVIHESILPALEKACKNMGKTCKIHLNVNIGLNRMGIPPQKTLNIAKDINSKPHLELEGLFGQPRDTNIALESFNRLKKIFQELKKENVAPNYIHFANSTTYLEHPDTVADGVRLGMLLYGVMPPEQFKSNQKTFKVEPVLSLQTEIVEIKYLEKGSKIGYRSGIKTNSDIVIATLPLGYNHGLDRRLLDGGYVLFKKQKAKYIGTISMNSSTIDVTGIEDIKIGDKVIIVGRQGKSEININELAERSGTIAAELMTRFGKSIARNYLMRDKDVQSEVIIEQEKEDDIHIRYYQTEIELPKNINVYEIVKFLQINLTPFDDPKDIISSAVDYALSVHSDGKGFILLATSKEEIVGVIVVVQLDKVIFIPENLIVYVCVNQKFRGKGVGSRLIREVIECTNGDVKLHVERSNPAIKLYKKLGFSDKYIEMRYLK